MIHVGIDIVKLNRFATAISPGGEILIEPFRSSNNYDGFYLLFFHLAPLDQNSIIIGLELAAHYGDNPVRLLVSKDFRVRVLSPIQTSSIRKSNVHKTKADKIDALVIVKTLMTQDSLWFMTLEDPDYTELRKLDRFHQKLMKQRTRLRIQPISYIDQASPELQYFFRSDLHQNSVYAVLKEAPAPNTITSVYLTHFAHTLEVTSHDHFGEDKVRELRVFVQRSISANDNSLSTQTTHTVKRIELLDSQLSSTRLEMANLVTCLHSAVMTIPRIDVVDGGVIFGEIGDIHQFLNPKKLLAFAGLDLTVYQSGDSQAYRTGMSKKGSKVLRHALMNAVYNVIENNATFKACCDTKRAEGRTHYNVLGHYASRLVRVVWKMLTGEVAFSLEQGICIPQSIDFGKGFLGGFAKVTLLSAKHGIKIFA